MGLVVRTLLIWLLVLAVPAQGVAAATMAFCGPSHHGGGSPRAELSATSAEHSHHGDALAGHELDADAAPVVTGADEVSVIVKASQAAKQKCSACASCCSLGAILTTLPLVPTTDSAPTVFVTVVPTVDAFAADGPDRPPRYVVA
jgi:hypothetical protein